jgi:uncharacterized protein (TIGR03086 family)
MVSRMSEIGKRFGRVAAGFTGVVEAVDGEAWSHPSPCDGWTARDVVGHLVEWIPAPGFLLGSFDIDTGPIPSVDDDPGAAWAVVRDAVQAGLDDPEVASRRADCGPLGEQRFDDAIAMAVISDVFVHTWDLARAAAIDVVLDTDELRRQHDAIASIPPGVDAAMRDSGHYGPRIPIAPDAVPLDVVLAFYGRRPAPMTPTLLSTSHLLHTNGSTT